MTKTRVRGDASEQAIDSLADTFATGELQRAKPGGPSALRERRRHQLAERMFGVVSREPVRLGRFVLLERLGVGGVGAVYIAYDPQLDRRVALKLLHPSRVSSSALRARMLREAQALARLSHPNVVPVYDAGVIDEQVFIVMEYVRGRTLHSWAEQERPTWRQILDVYLQAGDGLVAAHAAGVIHRDFKPGNAIRGDDGRVRVLDFGLARGLDELSGPTTEDEAPTPEHAATGEFSSGSLEETRPAASRGADPAEISGSQLNTPLTATGAVMGTPAYMAPEQFTGSSTDARTDQFSFSVALYEALVGQRPFPDESFDQLSRAVIDGQQRALPSGLVVPGWVLQIVERGLARAPDERWPSLREMLAALRDDPAQRRRRRLVVVSTVAALAVSAGLYMGGTRIAQARQLAACEAAGAEIERVWNDDARRRLREALSGANAATGETTADKVLMWLDRYADAWRDARTDACAADELRGEWDEDTRARVDACLEDKHIALTVYVDEFSRPRDTPVHTAVHTATALPAVAPCVDPQRLALLPLATPELRERLRPTRELLARGRVNSAAGDRREAEALILDALARAEELAWPPMIAAAQLELGHYRRLAADYDEAERRFRRAYFEAARAHAIELEAEAAMMLATTLTSPLARTDEALLWSELADVALSELGEAELTGRWGAQNLAIRGEVMSARGNFKEAVRLGQRSLELFERALPPDHPFIASALGVLASSYYSLDQFETARALNERVLELRRSALGPLHPSVAQSLNDLAAIVGDLGDHERAIDLLEESLEIREKAYGPDHPATAQSLNNLAIEYNAPGTRDKSRAAHERALAIRERVFGPDHVQVGMSLTNLGETCARAGQLDDARAFQSRARTIFEQQLDPEHPYTISAINGLGEAQRYAGELEEARALFEQALARAEQANGPEHLDVAETLMNLGETELELGRADAAEATLRRALAIHERALGAEHEDVGRDLAGLAAAALLRGQPEQAIERAERAIKLLSTHESLAAHLAAARFQLAKALRAAGREPLRARELGERALAVFRAEPTSAPRRDEAEAWLAEG